MNDYTSQLSSAEDERADTQRSRVAERKLLEWNRMAAVVSHEINNPLAAIGNLLFLMQISPGTPPEMAALVQQCLDEVKRIEMLSRSTLNFFRQASDPERVDLAAAAEAVRLLLGPLVRQKGIDLQIEHQGDCTVQAYAVDARQVLLDLVRNACEAATDRDSKVLVHMEGRGADVRLTVTDRGSGIEPATLNHLFEFRTGTQDDKGNGLGLWLSQQLVTCHGGTIEVESKVGEGTQFTVCWPRRMPESAVADGQNLDARR